MNCKAKLQQRGREENKTEIKKIGEKPLEHLVKINCNAA